MAIYPLFRYFDTNGDGTGEKNANGDYSVAPVTFKIVCPQGKGYKFSNIVVHVSGNNPFSHKGYGNITNGLINGWTMKMCLGGKVIDLLDGEIIKTNEDFEHLSPSLGRSNFNGIGDSMAAEISVGQFGLPLYVNSGDYIEVTLNDDFSLLNSHHFIVQGFST